MFDDDRTLLVTSYHHGTPSDLELVLFDEEWMMEEAS